MRVLLGLAFEEAVELNPAVHELFADLRSAEPTGSAVFPEGLGGILDTLHRVDAEVSDRLLLGGAARGTGARARRPCPGRNAMNGYVVGVMAHSPDGNRTALLGLKTPGEVEPSSLPR